MAIVYFLRFFSQMNFFELLCLGQLACISVTMMGTIVTMKLTGWMTLLTFIVAQFFQLGSYSVVGTFIETKVNFNVSLG